MKKKIKSFTDLNAWREGHKLVLALYQLTKEFPKEEVFVLTSQMRRCAVSITSNIAEGFSRKNKKEKIRFYHISLGSTTELQSQILIAKDLGYISEKKFNFIAKQTVNVHKLINGLIKSSPNYAPKNT